MIRRVQALGYRCLKYVDQGIGRFTVLVGANASGKTTFLDTISFVGDLLSEGIDYALGERQEGRLFEELTWGGKGKRFEISLDLEMTGRVRGKTNGSGRLTCRYEIAIGIESASRHEPQILAETFWLTRGESKNEIRQRALFPSEPQCPSTIITQRPSPGWRKIVNKVSESGNDYFRSETGKWNNLFRIGPRKSALANLPEDEEKFPIATWAKRLLVEGIVPIWLSAQAMRSPSPYYYGNTLLGDGHNLPWLVKNLTEKSQSQFNLWQEHVRTAIPDVKSISVIERPEDRSLYLQLTYQNGITVPSWLISEGTLRLLALTLIAYAPVGGNVYLIEEPENGLHPRAVETVYQSLSSVQNAQVLVATHSPVFVSLADPGDVLCFARTETGATDVVVGKDHPNLKQWQREIDLGTIFAAGVLV